MSPRDAPAPAAAPPGIVPRSAGLSSGGSGGGASDALDRAEPWLPYALFAFALAMRLYRLDLPVGVVFDESHFGRFTGLYLARSLLFDIHPPLGKLVFFWAVRGRARHCAARRTPPPRRLSTARRPRSPRRRPA